MKKMMIVLMVALGSSNSNAFEDLQSTPKDGIYECVDNTCFLELADQAIGEYRSKEDIAQSNDEDEYEQSIADSVQPPKISATQQMLAKVFGELLVRYISVREIARVYFQELKDVVNKWYSQLRA